MSKFLKKKIKHTLPIVVIFCLLNVIVLGLSFNLNLNFVKPAQNGFVNMAASAEAATATTSVIVKNSPPHFTAGPAENPISSSTSPINVGASIGFTGTGTDDEGDSYWMIVCTTTKATTTVDGTPPSCVGGTPLCLSSKASTTVGVSCTYNNVKNPGSEMQVWRAFVCDGHWGDQQCSLSSQGTGDSGSPFYVNHAPILTRLFTSSDNKDPGVSMTFTASSTDSDTQGGVDHMNLYVCGTNSWTVGVGCTGGVADTLCKGSSTVPTSASCTYSTAVPKMHGAYTYYGFIKDWHNMAASHGNGTSSTYNVNNVAPTVSNVTLYGGNNITLNIKNATKDITVRASSSSVTDNNGCTDLNSATSTIYLSSVAGDNNCAANNNNCYQIASSSCKIYNCSGPTSATASINCTTTLAFFTMPTDASSIASTSSWYAGIKAKDNVGLKGLGLYNTLNGVEVISSAALNVTEATIPYGSVQAGTNTGSFNASTTVVNYGNTPIDTAVQGQDMLKYHVGPEIIKVSNQQHSKNTFTFTAGNTSSTTPDTVTLGIPRPISQTDVNSKIYWGIRVPAGTPSATFYGVNTFTVVLNKYDNWQYP
jgi:hypothetical protein